LLPVSRNPSATVRDYVFAEQNWHKFTAHVRMVRKGDFVYLRKAAPERSLPDASDTFYTPSAETGDTVPAQPTASNIVLATGERIALRRGNTPGAAAGPARINAPGPIRANDILQ
jgi:hypothetical protein